MVAPASYRLHKPEDETGVFWSHRLYQNKDGETPKIYYCMTYEQAEKQAQLFKGYPVMGFDLEWEIGANTTSSTIKWNVSLIQIAVEDRIGLFHVASFKGDTVDTLMPPSLRELLESSDVTKTGVNISGDATRLRRYLNVDIKGLFELSHMYKIVQYSEAQPSLVDRKLVSMANQVKEVFGLPLLKEDKVRTGNWSKRLDMQQIDYAAADAYAGLCLYTTLDEKRRKMDPTPPRPAHYELFRPLVLGNGDVIEYKPARKRGKVVVMDDSADEEYFDALEEQEDEESNEEQVNTAENGTTTSANDTTTLDPAIEEAPKTAPRASTRREQATPEPTFTAKLVIRPPPKMTTSAVPPSTSPQLLQARHWVSEWRSGDEPECNRVSDRQLEIWHMWHHQNLGLAKVAGLARDPPLSQVTVASYVATVVKEADLPYDAERMRAALELLPPSVLERYGRIREQIQ